jgi:hypothetical protein
MSSEFGVRSAEVARNAGRVNVFEQSVILNRFKAHLSGLVPHSEFRIRNQFRIPHSEFRIPYVSSFCPTVAKSIVF